VASARLSCCRYSPLIHLPQRTLVLFVLTLAASASLSARRAALAAPVASYRATVLSVGDGDTLRVQAVGRTITIRLACIDAPETAQSPWGQESRAYLIQRLPRGRQVSIQPHTTDRYGRTVAEVISDINVNLELLRLSYRAHRLMDGQLRVATDSCQDVPSWLKRMRDRQLALPQGPGLLDPGWLEAQGLELHPDQPPLLEQLWLLLPEGRVRSSREARHLIRTLRLRLAKVGEELLGAGELPEDEDDPVNRETCQAVPMGAGSQNYAPSA